MIIYFSNLFNFGNRDKLKNVKIVTWVSNMQDSLKQMFHGGDDKQIHK